MSQLRGARSPQPSLFLAASYTTTATSDDSLSPRIYNSAKRLRHLTRACSHTAFTGLDC
jgi:hypothetical protein